MQPRRNKHNQEQYNCGDDDYYAENIHSCFVSMQLIYEHQCISQQLYKHAIILARMYTSFLATVLCYAVSSIILLHGYYRRVWCIDNSMYAFRWSSNESVFEFWHWPLLLAAGATSNLMFFFDNMTRLHLWIPDGHVYWVVSHPADHCLRHLVWFDIYYSIRNQTHKILECGQNLGSQLSNLHAHLFEFMWTP